MTIRPVKSDGTFLTAAPYEAVFLPQDTSQLVSSAEAGDPTQTGPLCNADGAMADPIGWPAQAKPAPWYALVTYPSCDLIAVIALPGGQIVSSAQVRPTGDGKSVTWSTPARRPSARSTAPDRTCRPAAPMRAAAASIATDAPTAQRRAGRAGPRPTRRLRPTPPVRRCRRFGRRFD